MYAFIEIIYFVYRLSENIIEVAGGNLSLEKIFSAFEAQNSEKIDHKIVSKLVAKLFPNAVKSKARSNVNGKQTSNQLQKYFTCILH